MLEFPLLSQRSHVAFIGRNGQAWQEQGVAQQIRSLDIFRYSPSLPAGLAALSLARRT